MNIPLTNLEVINQYNENYYLIADGNKLSLVEKNDFNPVDKLSSLEYPIYFTYHHLLNVIVDDQSLSYQKKQSMLETIDDSLYNLIV